MREALHRLADHGIFGYTDAGKEYFAPIRGWFQERFGWEPKQEWLICTPGVVYGFSAAINTLTQEGDAVLIQQPVYPPFAGALRESGRILSTALCTRKTAYTAWNRRRTGAPNRRKQREGFPPLQPA